MVLHTSRSSSGAQWVAVEARSWLVQQARRTEEASDFFSHLEILVQSSFAPVFLLEDRSSASAAVERPADPFQEALL